MTEEQVRLIVFSMGASKAPGLDGLQLFFFQSQWGLIGNQVTNFVRDIFRGKENIAKEGLFSCEIFFRKLENYFPLCYKIVI